MHLLELREITFICKNIWTLLNCFELSTESMIILNTLICLFMTKYKIYCDSFNTNFKLIFYILQWVLVDYLSCISVHKM